MATNSMKFEVKIDKKMKRMIKDLKKETISMVEATKRLSKALYINKDHMLAYIEAVKKLREQINTNDNFVIESNRKANDNKDKS